MSRFHFTVIITFLCSISERLSTNFGSLYQVSMLYTLLEKRFRPYLESSLRIASIKTDDNFLYNPRDKVKDVIADGSVVLVEDMDTWTTAQKKYDELNQRAILYYTE